MEVTKNIVQRKLSKKGQQVFDKINRDDLYTKYIINNESYEDVRKYYGVTSWTFDVILHNLNIHKTHQQRESLAVDTKYRKAGGKDNYYKKCQQHHDNTVIKKYGSIEAFRNHISNQCSATWHNKSQEEISAHTQKVMANGGGWNWMTSNETLKNKYGVNNAYALATYVNNSTVNQKFELELKSANVPYKREFALPKPEGGYFKYDFKIGNTLVELDPSATHNIIFSPYGDNHITKSYHLEKSKVAENAGYRCIHMFDWNDAKKLIYMLTPKPAIYARLCDVKVLTRDEAKEFINTYHLQGYSRDSIRLGLLYQNQVVSVMTFGKPRYNKHFEYELIRYCSSQNVTGGAEKLFKHFLIQYRPKSLVSYCDRSKFTGQTYDRLGFKLETTTPPSRHWYNLTTNEHYTEALIQQQGFSRIVKHIDAKNDPEIYDTTSNTKLMLEHNFIAVYDCGQSRYSWYAV